MNITGLLNRYYESDTDTDVIIPAKFLKRTALDGFEPFAFFEKRYAAETVCEPSLEARDFVFSKKVLNPSCTLNHPHSEGATVLLTWTNFGCGSSREHAVYALRQYKVIIGGAPEGKTAFADIFRDNCRQNLVWTPVLSADDHRRLRAWADETIEKRAVQITLDPDAARLLTDDGALSLPFALPAHHLAYLREGKEPFEMAKEQVTSYRNEVDGWFRATPAFFTRSPDALHPKA